MKLIQKHLVRVLLMSAALAGLTPGSGCGEDFSLTAFRDAAAGSITEGVSTVVEGMLAGFFAGLNPQDAGAEGTSQAAPAG